MMTNITRAAYVASVFFILSFSVSSQAVGQLFLRGRVLDSSGMPSPKMYIKSVDFVSNHVLDSVQTSNNGAFSLPIRRPGVHHIWMFAAKGEEYRASIYVEETVDVDIRLSQNPSSEPHYTFEDAQSHTARLFTIYAQLVDEFRKYRKATRNHPVRPGESSKGIFDWDPYVSRLNQQLDAEPDPLIHQALLIARLVPSVFGDTLSPVSARIALNSISPRHPLWEEATISCYTAERAGLISYLDSIVQNHPDPATRALTMFTYLPQGRASHDSVRVHQYATRLLSEFPGTSLSQMAIPFATNSMHDLVAGDVLPEFSFSNLNRPQDYITGHQLRGKVVLIAFWATWCIHCVEQMPFQRAAYDRYKNQGFEIPSVSLDDKPETAVSFLKARPVLPWQQAFAMGGFNNEYVKKLGVYAAPAEFLVDKNGHVVATTNDLIRSKLDSTLTRFFGK